jgi:hypothetical protein
MGCPSTHLAIIRAEAVYSMPVITTTMTGLSLQVRTKIDRDTGSLPKRRVLSTLQDSRPEERDNYIRRQGKSHDDFLGFTPRFLYYFNSCKVRFYREKAHIIHSFDTMSTRNLRRHARLRRLLQLSTNPCSQKLFSSRKLEMIAGKLLQRQGACRLFRSLLE